MSGKRRFGARFVRLCVLAISLGALGAAASAPTALAVPFVHSTSNKVALIPQNGPVPASGPDGIMPISAYVTGRPAESFEQFSFSNVALDQITTNRLSQFDTVALIQVKTSDLTASAKSALAQFVASGGKLIIYDSDETSLNDYSWLLPGPYTTKIGAGCNGCGRTSGTSTITNSSLISTNPADPSYVSLGDLAKFTDAIGDANLLVSTDPRWFALAKGTNANGESGAQVAFASNNGLIVYNGYDTDFVKTTPSDPWRCDDPALGYACPAGSTPTVDWIAHMWYSELVQGWGTPAGTGTPGKGGGTGGGGGGLPHKKPVVEIGTPLAATLAGLPSNRRCVAGRRLSLRLKALSHLRHTSIASVDVYLNSKRVAHEGGHLVNVILKSLPRHGRYTIKVIVTTRRGYHLIAKQAYRAC
jgi:hypothetical protein